MKLLDITLKDLLQSSRSRTIFFFMFVVPIGITLIFMIMFGGIGGDEGFQLPTTSVVIVNLDTGQLPFIPGAEGAGLADLEGAESMGDLLVQSLKMDELADLMTVAEMTDEVSARAAVDSQEAGVAIIIPEGFSASLAQPETTTDVLLYRDPTLNFGPLIVEAILRQIIDAVAATNIGVSVTIDQLVASGVILDQEAIQQVISDFMTAFSQSNMAEASGAASLVAVQAPAAADEESDVITEIVGTILGGMMVFFAFFTGSASMQTILMEEEKGTLSRLFTTPTSHRTILGGKGLASIITLVVQISVLLAFGALVLKIAWGNPASVIMAAAGIIIVASATGLFLVSMMQNTRQGGIIFGGVLTLTGMLGLIPIFTAGVPNQPEALQIVSLLVPQGWAMRGLTEAMDGKTVPEMLPVLGVILLWSLVFAGIGQYRLQRRFA